MYTRWSPSWHFYSSKDFIADATTAIHISFAKLHNLVVIGKCQGYYYYYHIMTTKTTSSTSTTTIPLLLLLLAGLGVIVSPSRCSGVLHFRRISPTAAVHISADLKRLREANLRKVLHKLQLLFFSCVCVCVQNSICIYY